jgi:hypothetical protein
VWPARAGFAKPRRARPSPSPWCSALLGLPHYDRDPGSEQVVNRVSGFSGIALKDGPQPYCDVLTRVPWGHWVALDCYVTNEQNVNGVTSWSHVRYGNGGPVYEGWISDYHLSNRGSNYAC